MKLDKFDADVQKFVNLFNACLNKQISKDEVKAELTKIDEGLDTKVFWALYDVRNSYEGLRSSHGYDHYDALLDIYKEASKYYSRL